MYHIPATYFGLYKAIVKEAVYKGIKIQQILSNVCMCRVKTECYELKLLNMFQISVNYKLFVFLNIFFFFHFKYIYVCISFCHIHSNRVALDFKLSPCSVCCMFCN